MFCQKKLEISGNLRSVRKLSPRESLFVKWFFDGVVYCLFMTFTAYMSCQIFFIGFVRPSFFLLYCYIRSYVFYYFVVVN